MQTGAVLEAELPQEWKMVRVGCANGTSALAQSVNGSVVGSVFPLGSLGFEEGTSPCTCPYYPHAPPFGGRSALHR